MKEMKLIEFLEDNLDDHLLELIKELKFQSDDPNVLLKADIDLDELFSELKFNLAELKRLSDFCA